MKVRALNPSQTAAFDQEYVTPARWASVQEALTRKFAGRSLKALDVGGGNGAFADKLLSLPFIREVTVVDREPTLLGRNKPHPRKQLLNASFETMQLEGPYDLIVMNWLLHHLVGPTYSQSRANIAAALRSTQRILAPGGAIFVYENMYDDWLNRNVSSFLIYQATSSKLLSPITRRLGANTAGVGVCFNSARAWRSIFSEAGLEIVADGHDPEGWNISLARRTAFLLRSVRCAYFFLRSTSERLSSRTTSPVT